jgi:hypothetical protein
MRLSTITGPCHAFTDVVRVPIQDAKLTRQGHSNDSIMVECRKLDKPSPAFLSTKPEFVVDSNRDFDGDSGIRYWNSTTDFGI